MTQATMLADAPTTTTAPVPAREAQRLDNSPFDHSETFAP